MMRLLGVVALVFGLCGTAQAEVTATFYSHKFRLVDGLNTDFPHGFVVLAGTMADGKPVNLHLGFSAKNIFFNVLWQPVEGALDDESLTDAYVSDSIRHFTVTLTDEQANAVLAVEHKWRTWPQPSYEIDTHNCVIFVKEIAEASGLATSNSRKFIHAPGDFLRDVAARNAARITGAAVTVVAPPPGAAPSASLADRVEELRRQSAAARERSTR